MSRQFEEQVRAQAEREAKRPSGTPGDGSAAAEQKRREQLAAEVARVREADRQVLCCLPMNDELVFVCVLAG